MLCLLADPRDIHPPGLFQHFEGIFTIVPGLFPLVVFGLGDLLAVEDESGEGNEGKLAVWESAFTAVIAVTGSFARAAPFALNGGEAAIGSRIGATPAGGAFQGVRADWLIQQVDIQFGDDVAVIGIGPVGLMGETGRCVRSMQLRL